MSVGSIAPPALRLTELPAVSELKLIAPVEIIWMKLLAVIFPALIEAPAAWKLPVDTGPRMVIDPLLGTGVAANTSAGLKLFGPPAAMNIEESAR